MFRRHTKAMKYVVPAKGFSLIELLVGIAIGLIGIVAIFQMLTSWDARRRSTTAGSDAQTSGVISLFEMEKSFRLAGLGYANLPSAIYGCPVAAYNSNLTPTNFSFSLYPLSITQGTSGQPDTITVLYGNSSYVSGGQIFKASSGTTKQTAGRGGFQLGDLALVTPQAMVGSLQCWLVEITANTDADTLSVGHDSSATYTSFYTNAATPSTYNDPANTSGTLGIGYLFDMGPAPALEQWSIQQPTAGSMKGARKLIKQNLLTGLTTEIMDGVVNLQAQYGVDGANGGTVDGLISASEWTTSIPTDWTKLLAVRVGVLTRSQQFDKDYGASATPSWAGGSFTMFNIDGTAGAAPTGTASGDPNDWRSYRYGVYEKTIPLRNIIWPTQQ